MGSMGEITLETPLPAPRPLKSLLTGKLKPLGELSILSGIVKSPRTGRIHVSVLGLSDDEHDMTFHGGPEKALHQYCSDHYPLWRAMYPSPEIAARFQPGGFGENLVVDGFNESNVCLGDVVRIGPAHSSAVGGENGFAGKTHELNRTGWYYRVLEEGWIEEGMEVRVVERRHSKWTITKMHHHVHRDVTNREEITEALQIKEMGKEGRRYLEGNLKKLDMAEEEKRNGGKKIVPEVWTPYRVAAKRKETDRIVALELEVANKPTGDATPIDGGSYLRLKLPNGLIRAYSVVGGTSHALTLGIARADAGRGGSEFIHTTLQPGDTVHVGKVASDIPSGSGASNHLFLVGGIGITAFLALAHEFASINYNFELHYAVRDAADIPFREQLRALDGCAGDGTGSGTGKVTVYDGAQGQRLNVRELLAERKWNTMVYACGPARLMQEVRMRAAELDVPDAEVHYEAFEGVVGGDPFTASVEGRDGVLSVGEEQSLLAVLRKAGLDVQSSCEVGTCGTCRVALKQGCVEHRGFGLAEPEKKSWMLSCTSRGVGHIVVALDES